MRGKVKGNMRGKENEQGIFILCAVPVMGYS